MALIDDFLADYDFVEKHAIDIRADSKTVYAAAQDTDFGESMVVRMLLTLRGTSPTALSLRSLNYSKFRILTERPANELLIGLAGRFWSPFGDLQDINSDNFREFSREGYAKAAWNFSIEEIPHGTRLRTETRIKCIGDSSRRYFRWYWTFVQPFSGWIRVEMLKAIKRQAELGDLRI